MSGDVARAYDAIRAAVEVAVLPGSPLATHVRRWLTNYPLPPSLLLPIAAAGGRCPPATALSASLAFLLLVMRWLDDLVDRDRNDQLWETEGDAGAAVLASTALTHAWACLAREPALPRDILVQFGEVTAVLAVGEAADRDEPPRTVAEWQRIAWRKTAVCFRYAVWAGARLTGHPRWPGVAASYGTYLGLYLQAADDIHGVFTDGASDLRRGRTLTLPLVELLPDLADAETAFRRREVDRLLAEMARYGVRERCEGLAAAYARHAQEALRRCPGPWTDACAGLLPALSGTGSSRDGSALKPHSN
jgi:geranylgeranyl pyrophosphate synthase